MLDGIKRLVSKKEEGFSVERCRGFDEKKAYAKHCLKRCRKNTSHDGQSVNTTLTRGSVHFV